MSPSNIMRRVISRAVSFGFLAAFCAGLWLLLVPPVWADAETDLDRQLATDGYVQTLTEEVDLINMDSNLELIGQIGGPYYAVAISGDYAFVGEGPGMVIIDISNPDQPIRMSKALLSALVRDIVVVGDLLYVVTRSVDLQVIDIADPAHPRLRGVYAGTGHGRHVAIDGPHAYVTRFERGLAVIDILDSDSLTLEGETQTHGSAAGGVVIRGNHAYIADGGLRGEPGQGIYGVFQVVDVTDPTHPQRRGYCRLDDTADDVALLADLAYVTTGDALEIVDISNPSAPFSRGAHETLGSVHSSNYAIHIRDNLAYIADGPAGVSIWSLADPLAPLLIGATPPDHLLSCLALGGDTIVGSSPGEGLLVIDANDPESPTYMGQYRNFRVAEHVAAANGFAYVCHDEELSVVNIAPPDAPAVIGNVPLGQEPPSRSSRGLAIRVRNDLIYVAGTYGLSRPEIS